MSEQPHIRRALVADAETVHAVLLTGKDAIPLSPKFDSPEHGKWVRTQCKNREAWIAEVGGETAGVMVMKTGEILYLVTVPQFHRHGIARAFIRHAVALIAKKYREGVTARVRPENTAIVKLLKSEGFKPHPILVAIDPWVVYFIGDVR